MKKIYFYLLILFFYSEEILSQILLVTSERVEPYVILRDNQPPTGIDVEIIRTTLKEIGIVDIDVQPLPSERAYNWVNTGKADGFLTTRHFHEELMEDVWSSDIIYTARQSLITRDQSKLTFWDFVKGSKFILGSVKGDPVPYALHNKILVNSNKSLLELLVKERIDGVLAEELCFFQMVHDEGMVNNIKITENIATKPVKFVLSKKSHYHDVISSKFNNALLEKQEVGAVDDIFTSFLKVAD